MAARAWRMAGAACAAVLVGAFAGNATVAGMAAFDMSYAPPPAGSERTALAEAAAEREAQEAAAALPPPPPPTYPVAYAPAAEAQPACEDCGDYRAGYRWAASRRLDDDAACVGDSWSFERGCVAYVAGETPPPNA